MGLGGGEMVVGHNNSARPHQHFSQQMLAGPALVGGEEIAGAEDFLTFLFQTGKRLGTCVAVVRDQHGGLLPVAHGVHSAVREHIQEHILVLQEKGVVTCFLQGLQAPFHRHQLDLLHNLGLVHFHGDLLTAEQLDFGHVHRSFSFVFLTKKAVPNRTTFSRGTT